MEPYVVWLIAGCALIIAELLSGTFYLLILGIAAFAGAVAGYSGLAFSIQVLAVVLAAIAGLARLRMHVRKGDAGSMKSLDAGQIVVLDAWVHRGNGHARVRYRNTLWDARVRGEVEPGEELCIESVEGSTLCVGPIPPA